MISGDDFLTFADDALAAMAAIVEELGDDLANRRLDTSGANSPYVLLTHCLGVVEYWGGHVVSGRPTHRDRDAEFVAHGPVVDLVARTHVAREQLAADVAGATFDAPIRGRLDDEDLALPLGRSQGGALVHVYEELAQHLGQMEVTRDVLVAEWGRSTPVS